MHKTPQSSDNTNRPLLAFTRVSRNDDGASFGAVIKTDSAWFAIAARTEFYTPNAMELVAAHRVLDDLRKHLGPTAVRLFVSEYVAKGFTLYLPSWKDNDWHRGAGSVFPPASSSRSGEIRSARPHRRVEIANSDLWMDLVDSVAAHTSVSFETLKSKGPEKKLWHNERALATTMAKRIGEIGISWRDVTKVFRPRFNPSLLSGANHDDPRDGY